tara:strand:- start:18547 stop:19248 length:702 start_codon:yes stop_codon:yes gene_type:complete
MNNRVVLITGSRKGIGFLLVKYFIDKGYKVIGCSRGESDYVHKDYYFIQCDVTNDLMVKSVVKLGCKKFGTIDILINNAGIASLNHSILTPLSTVKKVFETNFNGSFLFSRECAKIMIKKKEGRIINFSTVAVPMSLEGEMIYASSKSAVESMSKILSKELSKFNITVNTVGPTPIDTDLTRVVPKDKLDKIINDQTIKRFGKVEDIINVIEFFINKKSSFITGQTIYLGGVC